MKRSWKICIALICICCLLSGCYSWMDGEYHSVKHHVEEGAVLTQESVEVKSYEELLDAMTKLVESGTTKSLIYISSMDAQNLEKNMDMAIKYVSVSNAVGAYALSDITYEIGTNAGKTAIAVELSYEHGRSEILRIKQANTMGDVQTYISSALERCDAGIVIRVKNYVTTDIIQLIQNYVDANPQICMEMPQVAAAIYPNVGLERVIEISFTYQTSRDSLRLMQDTVQPVFASAKLYVSSDATNWEKYSQLYSFLMERYDYTVETSITPSYSLLRHGVGDSKAFATVYAAMCRQAGLNCEVLSGTRAGEAWYWNVLQEDSVYYHVDLLQCSMAGEFVAHSANEMSGYVWDYSAYPVESEGE